MLQCTKIDIISNLLCTYNVWSSALSLMLYFLELVCLYSTVHFPQSERGTPKLHAGIKAMLRQQDQYYIVSSTDQCAEFIIIMGSGDPGREIRLFQLSHFEHFKLKYFQGIMLLFLDQDDTIWSYDIRGQLTIKLCAEKRDSKVRLKACKITMLVTQISSQHKPWP